MYTGVNLIFLGLIILLFLQYWKWPVGRSKRSIILFVGIGIPFLVLRLFPDIADNILGYWTWGFVIRPWTMLLCVALMLIIAAAVQHRWRLLMYNSVVGAMVGFLVLTRIQGFLTDYTLLTGVVDEHGVCLQTSGYSCGPAAMSMALNLYGVEKSEREIAIACQSSLLNGTNEFLTVAYLRQHLRDQGVTAQLLTNPATRPQTPYIEEVKLNAVVNHWVFVTAESEHHFTVNDPLHGRIETLKAVHEQRSEGTFITFR